MPRAGLRNPGCRGRQRRPCPALPSLPCLRSPPDCHARFPGLNPLQLRAGGTPGALSLHFQLRRGRWRRPQGLQGQPWSPAAASPRLPMAWQSCPAPAGAVGCALSPKPRQGHRLAPRITEEEAPLPGEGSSGAAAAAALPPSKTQSELWPGLCGCSSPQHELFFAALSTTISISASPPPSPPNPRGLSIEVLFLPLTASSFRCAPEMMISCWWLTGSVTDNLQRAQEPSKMKGAA